jgi:hypothetical protein
MKLLRILLLVALAISAATEAAKSVAASESVPSDLLHWKWSGDGYYAGLTLMAAPGGECVMLFEEWGKLTSGDHWKELQRSYQMTYGSIHQLGDRTFIVFAELQRAAEFTIAVDGVLQLQWFPIATSKPADAELLSGRLAGRIPGLPTEMKAYWEPLSKRGSPAPC